MTMINKAEWIMAASSVATGLFVAWQSYTLTKTISSPFEQNVHSAQVGKCNALQRSVRAYDRNWHVLSNSVKYHYEIARRIRISALVVSFYIVDQEDGVIFLKRLIDAGNAAGSMSATLMPALEAVHTWATYFEKDKYIRQKLFLEIEREFGGVVGVESYREEIGEVLGDFGLFEHAFDSAKFEGFLTYFILNPSFLLPRNREVFAVDSNVKLPSEKELKEALEIRRANDFVDRVFSPFFRYSQSGDLMSSPFPNGGIDVFPNVIFEKPSIEGYSVVLSGEESIQEAVNELAALRERVSSDIDGLAAVSSNQGLERLIHIQAGLPGFYGVDAVTKGPSPQQALEWVVKKCETITTGENPSLF